MKEFIRKLLKEAWDSPDLKHINIDPTELKKMAAMDIEHSYEKGKWHGQNSADMQQGISNQIYSGKMDKYAILDVLYNKTLSAIPVFKRFKIDKENLDSNVKFNLNREMRLDADLDDEYAIKIGLWVVYNFKEDDIFVDERPVNTINVLFSPSIIVDRTHMRLDDPRLKAKDVDGVINKAQKSLYGSPDDEDRQISYKYRINVDGLTIEQYDALLPKIKENLFGFAKYVYGKYGMHII